MLCWGIEHIYTFLNAKASPVAKYLVDSIDGRYHISNLDGKGSGRSGRD